MDLDREALAQRCLILRDDVVAQLRGELARQLVEPRGIGAGVGARRTWSGFAPLIRASYTRSWSNIEIYDYSRVRLDVGITRDF